MLDKFVATRVGEELRRVESELSEGSEAERDIFGRLQVSLLSRFRSLLDQSHHRAYPNAF